jgi:hypothetical protein
MRGMRHLLIAQCVRTELIGDMAREAGLHRDSRPYIASVRAEPSAGADPPSRDPTAPRMLREVIVEVGWGLARWTLTVPDPLLAHLAQASQQIGRNVIAE